jgi:hypothetical protein
VKPSWLIAPRGMIREKRRATKVEDAGRSTPEGREASLREAAGTAPVTG